MGNTGIYTCSQGGRDHKIPGSYGHYDQDAKTFASWGVDYVKMDWCNSQGLVPKTQYTEFSHSLNSTGRPIFFEMCEWGNDNPWEWGPPISNHWRTTGDHLDHWSSTINIISKQVGLSSYSGKGGWNYMDFLFTGGEGCANDTNKHCPGQTDTEYRTEFSFWAFLNSGMIVATDIRIMTPMMKEILYNTEVIAINKDPLRKQGDQVYNSGNQEVWARPLADGSEAVILFNTGASSTTIDAKFSLWKWAAGTKASVRDLWAKKDLGTFTDSFSATVGSHEVVFIKLTKQ